MRIDYHKNTNGRQYHKFLVGFSTLFAHIIASTDFLDRSYYSTLISIGQLMASPQWYNCIVGITCIRFLSLDRDFNLHRLADVLEDEECKYYIDHYTFADGTKMDVLQRRSCYLSVSYGDSTGYTVSTFDKSTGYDIYKLTGSTDSISRSELDAIDYTDADSDKKVYIYISGSPAKNNLEITKVRIVDGSLIMTKEDEIIYQKEFN